MKALVTGGAGFTGKRLINNLLARGDKVKVIDKTKGDLAEIKDPALELIEGSIEDLEKVKQAVKDVEVIYHLAESFSSDPYEVLNADIKGMVNLLETAVENKVKHFLFASTHRVYGIPRYAPMDEEHPLHPEESRRPMYSISKLTREQIGLTYWRERELPFTVLRWWYSIDPTQPMQGKVLRAIIDNALKGTPIRLPDKGGGDFFLNEDATRAFQIATLNKKGYGQVFNLTSGAYITWLDLANVVLELTGSSSRLEPIPADEWKGDPAITMDTTLPFECNLDISKAERLIGYKPKYSPQEVRNMLKDSTKKLVEVRKKG
jgi:UDP-glucose 4-epimerase